MNAFASSLELASTTIRLAWPPHSELGTGYRRYRYDCAVCGFGVSPDAAALMRNGWPFMFELFPYNFLGRRVVIFRDGFVALDDDAEVVDRLARGQKTIYELAIDKNTRSADVQGFLNVSKPRPSQSSANG